MSSETRPAALDCAGLAAALLAVNPGLAPEQAAKFAESTAAGVDAFDGQLPTLKEVQQIGAGEAICTIAADGRVRLHPTIRKMRRRALRRKAQRRPLVRRSAPRLISRPARARAPRRRRAVGTRTAESRAGPGSDPDGPPGPLATTDISNAARGVSRRGEALPTAKVIRFPMRAIGAVLIARERDTGAWSVLCAGHGWTCGSLREAERTAAWLGRNRGLPVRMVGGRP